MANHTGFKVNNMFQGEPHGSRSTMDHTFAILLMKLGGPNLEAYIFEQSFASAENRITILLSFSSLSSDYADWANSILVFLAVFAYYVIQSCEISI
jgi:hypothetical protein